MTTRLKLILTTVLATTAYRQATAQPPQFATLTISYTSGVAYIEDTTDTNKYESSAALAAASPKNLESFVAVADLVSVNGTPVKGNFVFRGRFIQMSATPAPGQAIGDFLRGAAADIFLEIHAVDGTAIGTILTAGFTGGAAPPGVPAGMFLNMGVIGGTGAYLGARGVMTSPAFSTRAASIQEDPANRRQNGGIQGTLTVYLIPLSSPQVVSTTNGPAIVHATDGSAVTPSKAAKAGEVLTLYATGLGPTVPPLSPGSTFTANPLQMSNSPIAITVAGQAADVLYAGGYPGSTDGFQVNFRVPSGVSAGMAPLQLSAAFIPASPVSLPIQ